MLSIFLLFQFFTLILNELSFYDPQEVIDAFNRFTTENADLEFVIESLSKTFNDAYAFNEIYKNPPNNFNKVDFQKLLKEINIKNGTIYSVYQDLRKVLWQLEDLHIQFDLSNYLPIFQSMTLIFMNIIREISKYIW